MHKHTSQGSGGGAAVPPSPTLKKLNKIRLRREKNLDHVCTVPVWGEWPSGLSKFSQVTEVKLGRVRSNCGWVTSEA